MVKNTLTIRPYRKNDAVSVGILIADTYSEFNLSELTSEQRGAMLGPFLDARLPETSHRAGIAEVIRSILPWAIGDQREFARSIVSRGRDDNPCR
jgi:hypothetical protein